MHSPHSRPPPITVTVTANEVPLNMEVDTGASASIISQKTYQSLWIKKQAPKLSPTKVKLRTYTGQSLKLIGAITVDVEHNSENERLQLLVVEGEGPTLLGRDWLNKLIVDWKGIHQVKSVANLTLNDVLAAQTKTN